MHIQVLLRMVMSFATADFSPKSVCSQCGGTHTDSPTTNQLLIPPLSSLTLAGCSSENRKIEIENRKLREIATSHCCLQNRLILGKFICFPVKDIHIVRNRTGCWSITFPSAFPSLTFSLSSTPLHQVCGLAEEEVGLWSVHNCSLLLLAFPVFPLLWCGFRAGFRGISAPVSGAAPSPFLGSLPLCCSHLGIFILCIHKWCTIWFIKPIRALPNRQNGLSSILWELLSCTSSSSNLVFCSSFIFYHVSITFYSGKFGISVNCWSSIN